MKNLIPKAALLLLTIHFSSCSKNSVSVCAEFDQEAYLVGDTIFLDASCSENVDEYLWTPQQGLTMLGNGNSSTERFVVLPLTGTFNRAIDLTVSNSRSSRNITKSTLIL